ncbi:MAG TPA: hypothetical protein VIU87_10610 [Mycobacterium sp.]
MARWSVDLSAYAGESVEISLASTSDRAPLGIGVFAVDVTLPTARAHLVRGRPGDRRSAAGSAPNVSNSWSNAIPVLDQCRRV